MLYSFKTARCIGWFFLSFSYPVSGDYFAPVDASGRRVDLDQRPELLKSSIEFIAPAEYMVRPPMPPLYFFLIDVSIFAVKSGMLEVKYLIKTYIVLGRGLCILFTVSNNSLLSWDRTWLLYALHVSIIGFVTLKTNIVVMSTTYKRNKIYFHFASQRLSTDYSKPL